MTVIAVLSFLVLALIPAVFLSIVQVGSSSARVAAAEQEADELGAIVSHVQKSVFEDLKVRTAEMDEFTEDGWWSAEEFDLPGVYWKWHDPSDAELEASCPVGSACSFVLIKTDSLRECKSGVGITAEHEVDAAVTGNAAVTSGPLNKSSSMHKLALVFKDTGRGEAYIVDMVCQ